MSYIVLTFILGRHDPCAGEVEVHGPYPDRITAANAARAFREAHESFGAEVRPMREPEKLIR